LVGLSIATSTRASSWTSVFYSFMLPIWALFLMPMIVAAFTTLLAQIEYQAHGWDHILALPVARWRIFLAKAFVAVAGVVAMTLLSLIFTIIGATVGSWISGRAIVGVLDIAKLANMTTAMLGSALLFVALQTWVALRFSSFVVSLSFGIGGTMVGLAVAMTGTKQADWFPWVMPMRIVSAAEPFLIAMAGVAGGLIVLGLMIADLSRHTFK
jgi:ABC-2 type transport system permease protein